MVVVVVLEGCVGGGGCGGFGRGGVCAMKWFTPAVIVILIMMHMMLL